MFLISLAASLAVSCFYRILPYVPCSHPIPTYRTHSPTVILSVRDAAPPRFVSPLVAGVVPQMLRESAERIERDRRRLQQQRALDTQQAFGLRQARGPPSPTNSAASQSGSEEMRAGPSTLQPSSSQHAVPSFPSAAAAPTPSASSSSSSSSRSSGFQLQLQQTGQSEPNPALRIWIPPMTPTLTTAEPQPETKIKVHKLRKQAHRGPGQKKEASGLVGARRLFLEQKALEERGGVERVEAAPKPDNVRTWTAVVEGAEGSQFEGGVFFFDITFPHSYPMGATKIACLTYIAHPFVLVSGQIQLDEMAKLCFDVDRFSEIKYGGLERALRLVAAVVSGKLPRGETAEEEKKLIERGRLFTQRYAC